MKNFPLTQVNHYDTFSHFVDGLAALYPEKPAVTYFTRRQQEVTHTYREFTEQIYQLREALHLQGLTQKHIAIISENSYEWLVAYLAITSSGSVAVCIDAEQSDDTIRQMLRQANAQAAFITGTYASICTPVLPKEALIAFPGTGSEEGVLTFEELCHQGRESREALKEPREYPQGPDDMAAIVFTSGTSSLAKPVMLSHINILQNASDCLYYVNTHERIFTHLPFYHTYGMTCGVLSTLVQGSHLVINGNLKTVMRDLQLSGCDTIMTVPLLLEAVINQIWLQAEKSGQAKKLKRLFSVLGFLRRLGIRPKLKVLEEIRRKAFGTIHLIISGGAALGGDIEEQLSLLGLTVLQGYGITECSPLIAVNSNDSHRFGSVGYVLPTFTLKIAEEEILVRGTSLMLGYYQSPELTQEVMEDGWFKTGDLGRVDKKGFLFITGRKKNLIVFKNGKKVSPEKMEELVSRIPLVKEVVVYGAASGTSADDIKLAASIFPDPVRSQGMTAYDILAVLQAGIDEINAKLPFYQHIQMINIRKQPFAKTGSQKIKRHLV